MRCPKCNSERINLVTNITTKGYSNNKGLAGCFCFGLPGLLLGLCGSGKQQQGEFWVCNNCGTKFQKNDSDEKEKKIEIAQGIVAGASKNELQNLPNLISQARSNLATSEQALAKELEIEKRENIELVKAMNIRKYFLIAGMFAGLVSFVLLASENEGLGSILFILFLVNIITYKKNKEKIINKYSSEKTKVLEKRRDESSDKLKRLEGINKAKTDLQGMLGDGK